MIETLGILAVILTAVAAVIGHYFVRPKTLAEAKRAEAEAKKVEAEAANMDWLRLLAEIERLDRKIAAQDIKIAVQDEKIAEQEIDRRKVALIADEREAENKSLRAKLGRLEKRLCAIESLFKTHPITPEMQAALDRLDRDA